MFDTNGFFVFKQKRNERKFWKIQNTFFALVWSVMRVIIFNHCFITISHLHTKYISYGLYWWCCVHRQSCCHLFWLLLGECRCVCARVFVCSLNLWRLILVQLHVPNLVFLSCCCCSFAQIKRTNEQFLLLLSNVVILLFGERFQLLKHFFLFLSSAQKNLHSLKANADWSL